MVSLQFWQNIQLTFQWVRSDLSATSASNSISIFEKKQSLEGNLAFFSQKYDVDGFVTNVKWPLFHQALDWWLSQISAVFGRKKYFVIPKAYSERATQPKIWTRARGSGIRGSLSRSKTFMIYTTSSRKVPAGWYLLDKDDVVRLLRWDLIEVGWLRFGTSFFKPGNIGLTQGSPGSPGGCICNGKDL